MKSYHVIIPLISILVLGCGRSEEVVDDSSEDKEEETNLKVISITGMAEKRKMGAAIRGENQYVWIENLRFWPDDVVGKLITATGKVSEVHDLPVFIKDTSEDGLMRQGIPVPRGTNLREASKRLVMTEAKWELANPRQK